MNENNGFSLVAPRVRPVLDSSFRPAVLANRAFREQVRESKRPLPVRIALEQADGSVFHLNTEIFPDEVSQAAGNYIYLAQQVFFPFKSFGAI